MVADMVADMVVKVVEEVRDIVEIVSVMDKHVYKVKNEISRELTKEVRD